MRGELIHAHDVPKKELIEVLDASLLGLSPEQVGHQREKFGSNKKREKKRVTWLAILARQLMGPFIIILIIAAGISIVLQEFFDAFVIGIAVLINTALGFIEEFKADRSLAKLETYLPVQARVLRDGKQKMISAEEIVVGDILLLRSGDKIIADARILNHANLEIDESTLTGESNPVIKKDDVLDREVSVPNRKNMVFAGTAVVAGEAKCLVTAVGDQTQIGQIAALVQDVKDESTPLQNQLKTLAKWIGIAVLILGGIIFLIGVLRGRAALEMLYISVALAVAAVPEGLIVALTVILAIGMQRILKKKALVRKLVAAETLGGVSVICMDKTGTITTGEMTVTGITQKEGEDYEDVMRAIAASSKNGNSPTDKAITSFVDHQKGHEITDLHVVKYLPFDSRYKFSASILNRDSEKVLFAVGAPEILFDRSDMNEEDEIWYRNHAETLAKSGRVIAVARGNAVSDLSPDHVRGLSIIGLLFIEDPVRPDAKESVRIAREAGLHPVIITGDHPHTASYIAKKIELDHGQIITGRDLQNMSDADLRQEIKTTNVFARVLPRDKYRIVKAWHEQGESVAMTGDGVNDAPAIKAADIGIAVVSGTEVAKETADMVLLDNSFKTIISAIREGRIIFDNIRKVVVYLLIDSFSEMVLVFGALIFNTPLPILPAQILWINLITDGLPSLALTMEPGEDGIMKEGPRRRNEPILSGEMKALIFGIGTLTAFTLFVMYLYLIGQKLDIDHIRTFIFFALGIDSLVYVFATRTFRKSIFRSNPFKNRYLIGAVFAGLLIQFIPYVIPSLRAAFRLTNLSTIEWVIIGIVAVSQLLLIEIVKEIFNHRKNRK